MFGDHIVTLSVLAGVGFLIGSLVPVYSLLRIARSRYLRRAWLGLGIMIIGFIAGYLAVYQLLPRDFDRTLTLVICAVLVMGSVFVLSVAMLALRTTSDISRLVQLESEVIVDPLTGIYDRRFFTDEFERQTSLASRTGMDLSLLMIDLDHFKKVNDLHGHAIGDQVLAVIASRLNDSIRTSDRIMRYGGEELVVIAPNTGMEAALQLAVRLCERAARASVETPGGKKISVTVSIGVATMCPGDTEDTFFDRADAAVYQAKRAGRNRAYFGGLGPSRKLPSTRAA